MEYAEQQIRNELSRKCLYITKEGSFMFDNIDLFVALSEGNTSVTILDVYPFDSAPGNYECWDKVGQIVGYLMELKVINIYLQPFSRDEDNND